MPICAAMNMSIGLNWWLLILRAIAMNRDDHLGEKVLWVLEINGRMRVEAIAEVLNEKPKAVSAACVNLHRLGKAQPIHTGKKIRNRSGRKKPEIYWEIGPAENIPTMPDRGSDCKGKSYNVVTVTIGITDEDLEWMERYRQQRQQRQQQLSSNDARLRL